MGKKIPNFFPPIFILNFFLLNFSPLLLSYSFFMLSKFTGPICLHFQTFIDCHQFIWFYQIFTSCSLTASYRVTNICLFTFSLFYLCLNLLEICVALLLFSKNFAQSRRKKLMEKIQKAMCVTLMKLRVNTLGPQKGLIQVRRCPSSVPTSSTICLSSAWPWTRTVAFALLPNPVQPTDTQTGFWEASRGTGWRVFCRCSVLERQHESQCYPAPVITEGKRCSRHSLRLQTFAEHGHPASSFSLPPQNSMNSLSNN